VTHRQAGMLAAWVAGLAGAAEGRRGMLALALQVKVIAVSC
jgi:hypothetical protein